MSHKHKVPKPTVKRLGLYVRELEHRAEHQPTTISSAQLGEALGLTDAQVRKDLAYFGQFGHPGVGYQVQELVAALRRILGTDRTWSTVLVGAGNLGRALMSYGGWKKRGFEIVAVFDANADTVGDKIGNQRIRPMRDLKNLVHQRDIQLAMLAVPTSSAQEAATALIDAGVKGILNFAPVRLEVGDAVSVSSVDLAHALEQLAFQVSLGLTGSLDEDDE